jgi:hypothetical protein
MNVVSVIAGFVRSSASEGESSRNVPTNHQSVPGKNPSLSPQQPAPLPGDVVKREKDESSKVGQKTSASEGGAADGGHDDPMYSQYVLQQSSFRRQTGDSRPWARYL